MGWKIDQNSLDDGWLGTSPVDYFEPNKLNVYDTAEMYGNGVVTASSSFHQIDSKETRINPKGPLKVTPKL